MKLIELKIENFRGLIGEQNIINFENTDLIFLIGNNNNGKSTFLKAYEFFIKASSKATIGDFSNKNSNTSIVITAKYKQENLEDEPNWIKDWGDSNGIITIKKEWNKTDSGQKYTLNPNTKKYDKGGFGGFDTLLTKYSPTPIFVNAITTPEEFEKKINDLITQNHIKKLENNYKDKYDNILDSLQDLKQIITKSNEISTIANKMNDQFKKIFPKLEINIYSKPEEGIDISKTLKSTHGFEVKDNINQLDIQCNGHGVLRQALFTFINAVLDEGNYIILFEEPELYLHPKAIATLKEELYSIASKENCQVLCATHSPSMIDLSKPHSSLVRLTKDENTNNTKTHQVKLDIFKDEDKNKVQMINRFNPHICEAFYAEEIILVEGDTEAIIYRHLIDKHYKTTEREIFVLNTGSKSNMVFYQKILTHFGIRHTVIHDCDSKLDKNGNTNGAWTINSNIWNQIEDSNKTQPGIAKRYVHFKNFEEAHKYEYDKNIGKPLSAFNFAESIEKKDSVPCIEFLNDLFGENKINMSQDYLQNRYDKLEK